MENLSKFYCPMDYLESVITEAKKTLSAWPAATFKYYCTLRKIKSLQLENKKVPTRLYKIISGYTNNIYDGFITANFHYELFRTNKDFKEELETKLLAFLNEIPVSKLSFDSIYNLRSSIYFYINANNEGGFKDDISTFAKKHCNVKERAILDKIDEILKIIKK